MNWKLKIKNFGKIKDAELHDSSLRFIVGNNNSGKSYLMTLLWGIKEIMRLPWSSILEEKISELALCIDEGQISKIGEGEQCEFSLLDIEENINSLINFIFEKTKDELVSKLFNFKDTTIEALTIRFDFNEKDKVIVTKTGKGSILNVYINSIAYPITVSHFFEISSKEQRECILIAILVMLLQKVSGGGSLNNERIVYLPAARTGFMLTKDIINKASRRIAFGKEEKEYEPFIMPIMDFLDTLDNVEYDNKPNEKYGEICEIIEKLFLQGKLQVSSTPNKALRFAPTGTKEELPLRTASAVVTEIMPLYLLLKNSASSFKLAAIYYEEPEMCLHPQLQRVIAKLMIRLVNAGINLTVTTHSDIIIQHVNNMIRLGKSEQRDELMQSHGYEKTDLVDESVVSMYQFKENDDGTTSLEELTCGEYGFEVPTFNAALDNMLNEIYALQGEDK